MLGGLKPIELVVLQGTSFCNLNCQYCDLSQESRLTKLRMQPQLIEQVSTELFTSGLLAPEVMIVWHSGEPLTLPPSYYDGAIAQIEALRKKLVGDTISVTYDIQTNGVLIDEEWCALFKRHAQHLNIGISCDGPAAMHDAYRTNWGGQPTHARTKRGMDLLASHGIKYKVIAVVTDSTLEQPRAFFDFFNDRRAELSGFHFNILASANGNTARLSYGESDRQRYYDFYRTLLGYCAAAGEGGLRVQNFTRALGRIMQAGEESASSSLQEASAPLRSLNVDARGYVTTFYAGLSAETLPHEYGDGMGLVLGNIREMPLLEMVQSKKLRRISSDFRRSADFCASNCDYAQVCSGGFEVTKKLIHGSFDAGDTPECIVHVKALTDALLDDLQEHLAASTEGRPAAEAR